MKLFQSLWDKYTQLSPSAHKIHGLFKERGDEIHNDHIALRTFNDPRVNVDVLSKPFLELGYAEMGTYHFEAKKLFAKHFEIPGKPEEPKIFISQLLLDEFSETLQSCIRNLLNSVDEEEFKDPDLILKGKLWSPVSYASYQELAKESEYAAWLAVYGFCANHFTVEVNRLRSFTKLEEVNDFLEKNGFKLNASGGKIKGTPSQLLEQSSTLADLCLVDFSDGQHEIPSCYYEFARRYPKPNGKLYQGFIAASADKIFESTDLKNR